LTRHLRNEDLRKYLSVNPAVGVLGVLHGQDPLLEAFWGLDRMPLFERLVANRVLAVTGPTFSAYGETQKRPAAHHVVQIMRHHRVIRDAQASNLVPIPNTYAWGKRDRIHFIDWLLRSPNAGIVARDFSRTRFGIPLRDRLYDLVLMLRQVGRPFHIVLIGVGWKNGPLILERLAEEGHTASLLSSSPIRKAFGGLDERGRSRIEARPQLLRSNLLRSNEHFVRIAERTGIYKPTQLAPISLHPITRMAA
jgi:hypothetical protein